MEAKDPTTTRISRRAAAMRNCDTKTQSPSPVLKTDSCRNSASSRRKSASIARMPAMRPILKYRLAPPTTRVKDSSVFETGQGLKDKARVEKRHQSGRDPVRRIGLRVLLNFDPASTLAPRGNVLSASRIPNSPPGVFEEASCWL